MTKHKIWILVAGLVFCMAGFLDAGSEGNFQPLDISNVANMGFRDEKAGDEAGGWTDDGKNDIRDFPINKSSFLGVPFMIIDPKQNNGKSCIMLRGNKWCTFFPSEVELPINSKAVMIYFLHASAWTEREKNAAVYILRYQDGTEEKLSILEGRDIFEWYNPRPLERCLVAWLGESPFAQESVGIGLSFQTNPHPEKPISSLVLRSAGNETVPGIIAITLGKVPFVPKIKESLFVTPRALPNLVLNGDFSAVGKDGIPEGWETIVYGNAKVHVSRENVNGENIMKVEVLDPAVDSKVYITGKVEGLELDKDDLPGEWRLGAIVRVSVKAKVEGGKGLVRALWGAYSLDDARRTVPVSPKTWTSLEGVASVLDYRYSPKYCAVVCYPTAKGEVFRFSDFKLEKPKRGTRAPELGIEMDWPEITDEEARAVPSLPGNIIYDAGFNSLSGTMWWLGTGTRDGAGIDGSKCAYNNCHSDCFHLEAGRAYTVSAYLRADNPADVEVMVVHARRKGNPFAYDVSAENSYGLKKRLPVEKEWKRYHWSFIAGAHPEQPDLDSYELVIRGKNVYIDNVQIEEGPLREYQPRPVEGYVSIVRRSETYIPVYFPGESIEVDCRVVANSKAPESIDLEVLDYYGRVLKKKHRILTIQPGGEENWKENISLDKQGVYRVKLDIPGLEQVASHCPGARSMGLAIVNPLWKGANRIMCMQYIIDGCNFPRELQMRVARLLGVHFFRIMTCWADFEPEKGRFKFDNPSYGGIKNLDKFLAQAMEAGLTPWMTVDNIPGHPSGCNTFPAWLNLNGKMGRSGVDLKVLEQWHIYVRELVQHFGDRVRYFECLNETFMGLAPESYLDFLKVFYETIKEVDPDIKVIAPSIYLDSDLSRGTAGWLSAVVRDGLADNIDIFSFHNYLIPDADEPMSDSGLTMQELYETLKKMIPQIEEKNIPLWSNEYAHHGMEWTLLTDGRWPPLDIHSRQSLGYDSDFNEGVNWAVKDVVVGYYNGVRMFSPHILLAHGADCQLGVWQLHGISYDGVLKPYTVAFAQSCYRFRDAEPSTWFKVADSGSAYVFKTVEGAMCALFTIPHKGLEYRWQRVPKGLIVENVYGTDYPWVKQRGKSLRLAVGAEPVFLMLPGGTPDELSKWVQSAKVDKISVYHNRSFFGEFVPMTEHFPTWKISEDKPSRRE